MTDKDRFASVWDAIEDASQEAAALRTMNLMKRVHNFNVKRIAGTAQDVWWQATRLAGGPVGQLMPSISLPGRVLHPVWRRS